MSLKGLSRALQRPVTVMRKGEAALEFSSAPIPTTAGAVAPMPIRHGAAVIPLPQLCPGAPFIVTNNRAAGVVDYDVYIYGTIGTGSMKGAASVADLIQLLDTANEKATFTFHVCSGGGSVHEAAQVASAIQLTKARTISIAEGPVCSAAVTLWMSARELRVEDGAYFMQHMSMHPDDGNSVSVANLASSLVRFVCETTLGPLLEKGLMTQDEYDDMVDRRKDVWIAAGEMKRRIAAMEGRSNANV